jgi:hypothetical protein
MREEFNYTELCKRICEKYETLEAFARIIGISSTEITAKLNNADYFTESEIYTIHGLLGIDGREISTFFFTEKLEKTT